jgi:hypothetical protein
MSTVGTVVLASAIGVLIVRFDGTNWIELSRTLNVS